MSVKDSVTLDSEVVHLNPPMLIQVVCRSRKECYLTKTSENGQVGKRSKGEEVKTKVYHRFHVKDFSFQPEQ